MVKISANERPGVANQRVRTPGGRGYKITLYFRVIDPSSECELVHNKSPRSFSGSVEGR